MQGTGSNMTDVTANYSRLFLLLIDSLFPVSPILNPFYHGRTFTLGEYRP